MDPVAGSMRAPLLVTSLGRAAAQVVLISCDATLFNSKFRPAGEKIIT